MAKRRAVAITGADVELSPTTRALVTDRDVVLIQRGGDSFRLTRSEAEVLAAYTGPSEKVNLEARRSS